MSDPEFTINVVGVKEWDRFDDNLDIEVAFSDGRKFTATVFTLKNLATLFSKNKETGECANGLYFWASEMLIVEELDETILTSLVESLICEGEFESAFSEKERGSGVF